MRRQELLNKNEFQFEGIVSEPVLHGVVGGPAVMADQLSYLLSVAKLPNVTMRVVGQQANDPLGLIAGSFVLFDLPPMRVSGLGQPPVAYVEGYFGRIYLERDSEVALYTRAAERLRRVAYSVDESRDLVLAALKEWEQ